MKMTSIMKIALRALRRNKLRSVLTSLGIIIGVGAVIAMVGIGNGARAQVEAQIASLGKNVVLVFSGSQTRGGLRTGWGGSGTLTIDDALAIQREVSGISAVSPGVRTVTQIASGNQNWSTSIQGEAPEYFDIRQWLITSGVPFTEQDVHSANKVAVIGSTVSKQLFGDTDPIGQIIRIKNVPFIVTGLLSRKGLSVLGTDQDDVVIIPYSSAMKRVIGTTNLRVLTLQASSEELLSSVQQQVTTLLRQRHKIFGGKEDDFTVSTQQEIADASTATTRIMTILVVAIASVSLIVGGIGIMNIMLVSVTERTREIGIRMAVGARRQDILLQFLIEAITLSSIGGVIGIILGFGISAVLSAVAHWPTLISPLSVIVSFLFSAAVGVFFGFYPARKASNLNPIEALRYE